MKKLLMAIALLGIVMTVGCTTFETANQHNQRLWMQKDVQCRELVEDFDMFWLFDRNSKLTQWHEGAGI